MAMASVTVRNWKAAVTWYQDMLGLIPSGLHEDQFCFMTFPQGDAVIALDGTQSVRGKRGNWYPVVEVDDLRATVAELKRRGVRLSREITSSAEGFRTAVVLDPEDNEIQLFDYRLDADKP